MMTFEQHVRARTPTREEIDHFLDPEKLSWAPIRSRSWVYPRQLSAS